MNAGPIPPTFAANRSARAAALLALAIACAPALASSSLTPCDEEARNAQSLDVPALELSIRTADLGSADAVTAGRQPLDQPIESRESALPLLTLTPRAESILQKMFEEPQFSPPSQLDPLPAETGKSAPVAEVIAPQPGGDKIEQPDDVDARIESEESNGVSTRLPGVTTDDLVRFKRRMYRTDI